MAGFFKKKLLVQLPPWIVAGAVAILLPLFTFMTIENINRQKRQSIRLLVEKGAALIRSFEAGTRTGMMGMQWSGRQLQRLLYETSQQPDIKYLMVIGNDGTILAHGIQERIGNKYGTDLDLLKVASSKRIHWRIVKTEQDTRVLEVFRAFAPQTPFNRHMNMRRGLLQRMMPFAPPQTADDEVFSPIIFVGLDMTAVEKAISSDINHTIFMAAILLLIGFAGIILLFLSQNIRRTKRSLSAIKAFSDTLIENMPIGLIATDSEKRVIAFNRTAEMILMKKSRDVLGSDACDLFGEELKSIIQETGGHNRRIEKEMEIELEDGSLVPLEVFVSSLERNPDDYFGHIIIFRDLREIRKLKRQIATNQRLASVGRLASGVAHEIRNPLSSIKGFATYFKERYRQVPEDQQIADIMINEVERLNRVVGQLLEFSRPIGIIKRPVDLCKIIDKSLKMIEKKASNNGIEITKRLDIKTRQVTIDPDRISQVLLNIFINAIEAMPEGGRLTISTEFSEKEDRLIIKIEDTGIGIDEGEISHIFEPYFTTKPTGTGLGLAIVNNIIEAHDGRISFKSDPGRGTTVTISLPANGDGS